VRYSKRNFDQVRADMIRDKIDRRVEEDKKLKEQNEKDLDSPDQNKGEQNENEKK